MKSIQEHNFSGERALIRVDYNVPLDENFNVTDVTRIVRTKDTIGKILNDGGSAILLSHLGRPKGEVKDDMSLRHIVKKTSEILGTEVVFGGDVLTAEAETLCKNLKPGSVVLMENLRFHFRRGNTGCQHHAQMDTWQTEWQDSALQVHDSNNL